MWYVCKKLEVEKVKEIAWYNEKEKVNKWIIRLILPGNNEEMKVKNYIVFYCHV